MYNTDKAKKRHVSVMFTELEAKKPTLTVILSMDIPTEGFPGRDRSDILRRDADLIWSLSDLPIEDVLPIKLR
jgi:hypothetical protein